MSIVIEFGHFLETCVFGMVNMTFDMPPNICMTFYGKFQVERYFCLGLGPNLSDNLLGARVWMASGWPKEEFCSG